MRIDGDAAPLAWYPMTLAFSAATLSAIANQRYQRLKTVMTGTYGDGRFPMLRVMRVLPRAETAYRQATGSRKCAPLYLRATQTLGGPAGWFTDQLPDDAETRAHEAEFLLGLLWLDLSRPRPDAEPDGVPIPGSYLYLHEPERIYQNFLRRERRHLDGLQIQIRSCLEAFDQNVGKLSSGGCFVQATGSALQVYDEAGVT